MRISDWSSDVCSSDLPDAAREAIIRFLCRLSLPPVRRGGRRPLADRMTDETPPEPFDEAQYRSSQRSRANLMGRIFGGLAFLFFFFTLARMMGQKLGEIGRAAGWERVGRYGSSSVVAE